MASNQGNAAMPTASELEKRILDLEAALVEQEHRPTHIAYAWFTRKKWPDKDPRRNAAIKAILWRLLFSPTTVAIGGGIIGATIGIATLAALLYQNSLVVEQNKLAFQQNELAAEQNQAFLLSLQPLFQPKTNFRTNLIGVGKGKEEGEYVFRVLVNNSGDLPIGFSQARITDPTNDAVGKSVSGFMSVDMQDKLVRVFAPRSMTEVEIVFVGEEVLQMFSLSDDNPGAVGSLEVMFWHAGMGMLYDKNDISLYWIRGQLCPSGKPVISNPSASATGGGGLQAGWRASR